MAYSIQKVLEIVEKFNHYRSNTGKKLQWLRILAAIMIKFFAKLAEETIIRKKYAPGRMGGWVDVKAILRIAYSNQ